MLVENDIRFPDGIYFYGDSYFNILAALYADKIVKTNIPFYHYYQHPNQSVRSKNDKRIYDRVEVAERITQTCQERGIYDEYKAIIDDKSFSLLMESANACIVKFDEPNMDILCKIHRKCKEQLPEYKKKSRGYRQQSIKSRFLFDLLMLSPKAAVKFYGISCKVRRKN